MNKQDVAHVVLEMFGDVSKVGSSGLVMRDDEIAFMLAITADLLDRAPCLAEDCEGCDLINTIWWGWCNDLAGPVRIRLQRHLSVCGITLPPGPVEIWRGDAVPTPL